MKSLFVGASGVRTITLWTREGGERALHRTSGTDHARGGGLGFGGPAFRTAVTSRDSPLPPVSSMAPSKLLSLNSTASSMSPSYLRMSGASVMASSALKQSAAVALDQSFASVDEVEGFVDVAHKMADAAGDIIRQFFRTKIAIVDKEDLSPVTVADRRAEYAMSLLINQHFPTHGIFGEEGGLQMPGDGAEYVWVLDPIDGTKSFITGKPLFGTLIALVHKGVPILGIIDQPVLRERWVGRAGQRTTLNGDPIASRSSICALKDAYLYTTSPHLFAGPREEAFNRVRDEPYDFLALVPVIEGAGGHITDWKGQSLRFWPNSEYPSVGEGGTEVAAAGSAALHKAALAALAWK